MVGRRGAAVKIRLIVLLVATMIGQRLLGSPALPAWCAEIQLLVVWLVAASLTSNARRWIYWAAVLGICWDLLVQPVIGPGGVAWSAAALTLSILAVIVADRTFKAWAIFGAVAAAVVITIHALAILPLGFEPSLTAVRLLRTAALSGLWCGAVGAVLAADFPKYWRAYRLRRLR
jgi:hypothetical protein